VAILETRVDRDAPEFSANRERMEGLVSELRERTADGFTLRDFTRFFSAPVPTHKAFHRAFCRLRPETVRALNEAVVRGAVAQGLEDGQQLRSDTTVVETNIHLPTDSGLLWDGVRVLTRLVGKLQALLPERALPFVNHTRRARRRMLDRGSVSILSAGIVSRALPASYA